MGCTFVFFLVLVLGLAGAEEPWEAEFIYDWAIAQYQWIGEVFDSSPIQYIRGTGPSIARRLDIVAGCGLEAKWSLDLLPVPLYIKHDKHYLHLTGPPDIRQQATKQLINQAMCRCALYAHPFATHRVRAHCAGLGIDLNDTSTNAQTPVGLGNLIAELHIATAKEDGLNSEADHPNTVNNTPFYNPTNFAYSNDPQRIVGYTHCEDLRDPNSWQPTRFFAAGGVERVQVPYFSAVFANYIPYMMTDTHEFLAPHPPLLGTPTEHLFRRDFEEVLNISGTLDDIKKVTAEHWQRGHSTTVAPKLLRYMMETAMVERLSLDDTLRLAFMTTSASRHALATNAASKFYYKYPRPTSTIQCLWADEIRDAWLGPYLGVGPLNISQWRAYVPFTQVTNAGFEYPSGAVSASPAVQKIANLFFGSDEFKGFPVVYEAGSNPLEPKIDDPSDPRFIDGLTNVANTGPFSQGYSPANRTILRWLTWTELVRSIIQARADLGVHLVPSGEATIPIGHKIGARVFEVVNGYARGKYPDFQIRRLCENFSTREECRTRDLCRWRDSCVPAA